MKNIGLLVATIVGSLVLVVAIAFFFSSSQVTTNPNTTTESTEPAPQELVLGETKNTKGPEGAKVTLVEFSDFQCPSCKAMQKPLKDLIAKYPNDVRFVYRHFPIVSLHKYAQIAAQGSEAAAEQGKFWEFHDLLFDKQTEWSRLGSQKDVEAKFVEYAGQLGIDTTKFRERITSDEIKKRVLDDVADAQELDVSGTPSLFINNTRVPAPEELESTIQSLIESQE